MDYFLDLFPNNPSQSERQVRQNTPDHVDRNIPPSDLSSFDDEKDGAERVQNKASSIESTPFIIAIGLWAEKSGISRLDYVRLRELLQLIEQPSINLPAKLDTLKRRLRTYLPMLTLMRKALPVLIAKQATLPSGEKTGGTTHIHRMSWQYWYDPIDLVRQILSADKLRSQMYFGKAQYQDKPEELWHSRAWGSSIRATSGENVYTTDGKLLIPGDIVRLHRSSTQR